MWEPSGMLGASTPGAYRGGLSSDSRSASTCTAAAAPAAGCLDGTSARMQAFGISDERLQLRLVALGV